MTVAMSLALCHSNTAKIKVDSRMLSTRQASKNQVMPRRTDAGTLEVTGSSILVVEVDSHVATGDRKQMGDLHPVCHYLSSSRVRWSRM